MYRWKRLSYNILHQETFVQFSIMSLKVGMNVFKAKFWVFFSERELKTEKMIHIFTERIIRKKNLRTIHIRITSQFVVKPKHYQTIDVSL